MKFNRRDWNPDAKKIRNFAASLAGGSLAASAILLWRGKPHWPWVAAGGLLCAAAAYFWRAAGIWLYRLVNGFARALTELLSSLILAVAYYAFVSPLAVLLRRFRQDGLNLKPGGADSFWQPLPEPGEKDKIRCERLY